MGERKIIQSESYSNYSLVLYEVESEDYPLLAIDATNSEREGSDLNITLDLKMRVEDVTCLFESSRWNGLESGFGVDCMLCGSDKDNRLGVWIISKHEIEFITHEECVTQLEGRVDEFCKRYSSDIVSRI